MNPQANNLGFVPSAAAPAAAPAAPTNSLGFVPSGAPASPAAPSSGGGGLLSSLGSVAAGGVNFINNNPISRGLVSLAALPLQLGVKGYNAATGSNIPDPYAGGIGGGAGSPFAPVGVTSSDQPAGKFAEQELGNAATVGSMFVPAGAAADAITGGAGLLGSVGRIGAQAALGAGQGIAGGMQQGQSAAQLGSSAKTGALIGGSLATAGELGSALVNSLANTTGATKLQSHIQSGGAAKTLTRAFNDASTPTTNPIQTMEQNGLIKDLKVIDSTVNVDGITNTARTGSLDNLIQDQQDMGTQAVKQMTGGIPTEDFKQQVIDQIKANPALKASGRVGSLVSTVESRFADYTESYGDTIPYQDVNAIRVAMNKTYDPETWDAEKAIGNAARSILYNGTGAGTTLKSAMANEGELINTKEFLAKLSGTKVKGGALTKIIADATAAGVGAAAGAPIPFVGPALGAAASAYATNKAISAMQGNYFNPILGNAARSFSSLMPAVSAAKQIGQAGLIPSVVQGGQ